MLGRRVLATIAATLTLLLSGCVAGFPANDDFGDALHGLSLRIRPSRIYGDLDSRMDLLIALKNSSDKSIDVYDPVATGYVQILFENANGHMFKPPLTVCGDAGSITGEPFVDWTLPPGAVHVERTTIDLRCYPMVSDTYAVRLIAPIFVKEPASEKQPLVVTLDSNAIDMRILQMRGSETVY
jgi:hypothetical protein